MSKIEIIKRWNRLAIIDLIAAVVFITAALVLKSVYSANLIAAIVCFCAGCASAIVGTVTLLIKTHLQRKTLEEIDMPLDELRNIGGSDGSSLIPATTRHIITVEQNKEDLIKAYDDEK